MSKLPEWLEDLFSRADIQINGRRPWDLQCHDEAAYNLIAGDISLGLGESYMDGMWDCEALDQFFDRALSAHQDQKVPISPVVLIDVAKARLLNRQNRKRSLEVAKVHYDIGNAFYEAMLDPYMQYTCAYWAGSAGDLASAQEAKLDLICRKLGLAPGEKILELGCGWGGFARYAAEHFGVEVVAYNISTAQVEWARNRCKGLPVEFRLQDYREATGAFDKVAAIGLCEHVGYKNYRSFLELAHGCLKPGGIFLLHTIGRNRSVNHLDAWMERYIFPGGMLPSAAQLGKAMDGLFVLEDWHSFGTDYDRTLMAWHENVERSWSRFSAEYGERFHRMWRYYLLSCAGAFRCRQIQLWQVVLSKEGIRGGWKGIR
jgi:cyclopropane-fatty-acyl-phospholipid synthase